MKHIAIIIQKLHGGGAEHMAANLSLALQDKYHVHLIVFDGANIKYPYGGTLHDLHLPPMPGRFNKLYQLIRRVRVVKKIKEEYKIETSISLMDGANFVNVFSKVGDTIITSVRIQMSRSRFKKTWGKYINIIFMRFIAAFSRWVVAVSEGVRLDLIHNFGLAPAKVITIHNFCNIEFIQNIVKTRKEGPALLGPHSITTMGRCTIQKGQWHLIRSFGEVIKKVPDAKLYILGEGPFRPQLEKLVEGLKLTKQVTFLGFRKDPFNYLAQSQCFVLPSLFEGCPNVLIEAMACGTASISTDCPSGSREILAPGTNILKPCSGVEYAEYGILTPVDNSIIFDAATPLTGQEKILSQTIIRLLTDDKLEKHYKAQALKRSQDFSPQVITAQWEKLL